MVDVNASSRLLQLVKTFRLNPGPCHIFQIFMCYLTVSRWQRRQSTWKINLLGLEYLRLIVGFRHFRGDAVPESAPRGSYKFILDASQETLEYTAKSRQDYFAGCLTYKNFVRTLSRTERLPEYVANLFATLPILHLSSPLHKIHYNTVRYIPSPCPCTLFRLDNVLSAGSRQNLLAFFSNITITCMTNIRP